MTDSHTASDRIAPLRIGLLGCGGHSRGNHGPALRDLATDSDWCGDLDLVACCDLRAEAAAAYAADFGFARHYTDLDAMLAAESLDGLIAVTPVHLTYPLVGRLLELGLPLLVEKPVGETAAQARDLAARADALGRPVMVSMNRRFQDSMLLARDWLARETWGRGPVLLQGCMTRLHRSREPRFAFDTGIHLIDASLALMGPRQPRLDSLRCACADIPGGATCATLAFSDGSQAQWQLAPATGRHTETYRILGADAQLEIDAVTNECRVYRDDGFDILGRPDPIPPYALNGTVNETRAFLEMISSGRAPWPSLHDAARAMSICEGLLAASPES